MVRVIADKVMTLTRHPWGAGSLVGTGVQYEGIMNGNSVNEANWTVINERTLNAFALAAPYGEGELKECEIGFNVAFQSPDNSIACIYWKVQGKNINSGVTPSWVDLSPKATQAADIASWKMNRVFGLAKPQANFNRVPFLLRCVMNSNAAEVSTARICNNSYVTYSYTMD